MNSSFVGAWADIRRRLRVRSTIRNWGVEKGYTGGTFDITDVDSAAIVVKSVRMAQERRVSKGDFERLFPLWPGYRDGELRRADPRIMRSQNSTYVISILHWRETPQGPR